MEQVPNLELLLYQAMEYFNRFEEYTNKMKAMRAKNQISRYLRPHLVADTFIQSWPNTATGFDAPESVSGQAITMAYTTVVHELVTNMFVVFIDNRPCYFISHPTKEFIEDLRDRNVVGRYYAQHRYGRTQNESEAKTCGRNQGQGSGAHDETE